jgi:hypothetical protein
MQQSMPDYYILEVACNTKETGPEYPQVQKMNPGYDYKAPNSVYALSRAVEKLPEFQPNLNYFIVEGKAKLTDLLSAAPISGGLLISPLFKSVLEKFRMPIYQFYPAMVSHKKAYFDYYWLHLISNLVDSVNYSKSTFFIYHNYKSNLGYIDITSKEDFTQKKAKIKKDNPGKTITIWAEKIKLNSDFDSSLDLFEIGTFDSNIYITEKVKAAITSANITGCLIKSAPNIF